MLAGYGKSGRIARPWSRELVRISRSGRAGSTVRTECHNGEHGHRHDHRASSRRPTGSPSSWGLGDGQAIPWEYAPAPEARDIVTIKERYGLFIGGRDVAADGRRHVRHRQPGHRGDARAGRQGRPPADADKAVRAARRAQTPLVGHAPGQGTGQVPVPDRAHPPGAQPRVRRPRIDGLGQADQGEPRRRRAARGGPLLVLRRLGGQARVRVPGPGRPAARRRRPDHPVELPAADARLEDRPGPRRRQHGRPQARLHDAAVARSSSPTSAARPTCRPGVVNIVTGPGRDRDGAGHPPGRRQGRVHRLDRDRQADRQGRRRHRQGADPRARRQGRQHRVRRRAARPGRRGHRQRHLLQPGRGVLRRVAPARPGVDRRAAHRQAQGPPVDDPRRRPARQEHRRRGDQLEEPAREDHRARRVRRGRGRRALPARLRPARPRLLLPPDAVHQRRPEPPDRARGDLRAGAVGADVPDAGRGGREGQQHGLRPVGRDLDRQGLAHPRDGRRRCGPASSGPTRSTGSTRPRRSVATRNRASGARAACTACTPTSGWRTADGARAEAATPRTGTAARRDACATPAVAARIEVRKTYKLYIGGAFPRTEIGPLVPRLGRRRRRRSPTPAARRARTSATRSGPRARRSRAGPPRPR